MDERTWLIVVAGGLLAALCLWGATRAARRARLVRDLPTCSTDGVFIGLVELKGRARSERPLTSFLAERPCVHYAWCVQEHWRRTVTETYTDKDGKTRTRTRVESGWTTVASGGEQQDFYLQDEDGAIRIRPAGAEIEPLSVFDRACSPRDPLYYGKGPAGAVANSTHTRSFTEKAIPIDATIYVVGMARERDDVIAPEIAAHRDAPMYLISTRSEQQVRRGYTAQYWFVAALGLVLWVAGWVVRDALAAAGPVPWGERLPVYAGWGAAYLGAWLLAWVWLAYNSLVGLRQRVRQAWANVDVQLKRRADLIPNLVRAVEGLRDHERQVQTHLAELRAQAGATAPGEPGPDPHGCLASLLAIVERYPELKASESFLRLQRELAATEQRIALARGYFNEIATFYNTRLESVPDGYVAALAGMRPKPLITATDFERAAAAVQLSA